MLFLWLLACEPEPIEDASAVAADPYVPLAPQEQLLRVSMTLRGARPTQAERALVAADPGALADLADAWVRDPAFGAVARDVWAEALLVRADTLEVLPPLGPLEGEFIGEIQRSANEEPLRVVERVVTEGRPFTEVVTADWTMTDRLLSIAYGLPFEEAGPDWQESRYPDGRPHAGVLSTNGLWFRHGSAGANYHRGRANLISRAFLCEDYLERDIAVDGALDLSDPEVVADAVNLDPACVSCHQSLDPLAANLWGFSQMIKGNYVVKGYDKDCGGLFGTFCYPMAIWDADATETWQDLGLRAPGLAGEPTDGVAELGAALADDPRFAACAARRFAGWITQVPADDVPFAEAARLQGVLEGSGFDAREVVKDVVLSERFLARSGGPADAPAVGLLPVRPEQLARALAGLTGFTWQVEPDAGACELCFGPVDLLASDQYGYRAMAGGVDGASVTRPTSDLTPIRLLVAERVAVEASGFVVDADFALPAAERRLLPLVEAGTVDEAAVRAQLAALHERILAESPADADVDATFALFDAVRADADPPTAWKAVIAAMLQDDRFLWY